MYQHQRAKQLEWLCCPRDINAGLSTEQMFSALLRWKGMFTVKITLHMFLISLLQKHLGEIHRADLQVYYLLRRPIGSCAGTKMVVTLCAINSLYTFEFCNKTEQSTLFTPVRTDLVTVSANGPGAGKASQSVHREPFERLRVRWCNGGEVLVHYYSKVSVDSR